MNKLWLLTTVFSVFTAFGSSGQTGTKQEIRNDSIPLSDKNIRIGEVVVSSLRMNRKMKELPTSMSVVEAYDYQRQSSLTLSNVLNAEPGISMGSDGVWATSINVRGLSENRLVTLIDGNRIETATDLTASFSMIDVNDIERVEVIKGAQSSLYGTGAMGGIVNIITKDGHFSNRPYLSGNVISGFASANKLFSNHAAINTGADKWYLRLSGTYGKADDIRTPEGKLPNSQFTTSNISAKVGFQPINNHVLKVQFQRNWSTDVGIPGGAAFPGPAEATYSDIGRQLLNASYEITNISNKLTSLKLNYFNQNILRDVLMKPNTVAEATLPNGNTQRTTPEKITPTGKHLTNGVQLQSTWNLNDKNVFIAGIDYWGRKLTTEREKYVTVEVLNPEETIIKTNNIVRGETPIPESNFNSAGLFLQNESHLLNNRLTLITGGRVDGIWIKNEQGFDVDYLIINGTQNDSPPTQRITFEKGTENNVSWSANAGLLYQIFKDADISLNLARSFRAPSLEERFKYIDLGNYVRLGNPALKPESGYSADLGLRIWNPKLCLQSGVFVNQISNMIVESPGEFIYTLTSESTPDTIPALINSNVSKALLYGFDFKLDYNFYDNLVVFLSGAYVRGKDTKENENLPLIPPLNGQLGIRYSNNKAGSVEFSLAGAAKQDKIADGETETDAYTRLDMTVATKKFNLGATHLQIFSGIDNITNTSYTNHLSTNRGSISVEPGQNIFVRLNFSF
ncbi:hemoglobin/transferrin/lactoferrin receptor protein [Mariniphaga anaerophila]|uniref:Hemoglobin/transferrin/lactoferrin receptor protein n=1 Tax=Mariniphaga anaerophila TaxID=1484053 RepID=A0A1M5FD49_9BACT|nr:TonB-dependent receptor [Mariniphaga anaerophila]SHF89473.1 hemoglobin/transferrin/lactoferrin receptor protein [Mariniphaga anaerophila]